MFLSLYSITFVARWLNQPIDDVEVDSGIGFWNDPSESSFQRDFAWTQIVAFHFVVLWHLPTLWYVLALCLPWYA